MNIKMNTKTGCHGGLTSANARMAKSKKANLLVNVPPEQNLVKFWYKNATIMVITF